MRINWISDSWTRVKNHCRTTVNKSFTDNEPTKEFKKKLLISEHSPIRLLEIDWTWENIKYWVSTEWSRHKFEKFITSQRDDRMINEIPRDKKTQDSLVNYGFRLPSAYDNRPLKFEEFEQRINQVVFVSATPADYEKEHSKDNVVEQIIRPTGLLDPKIEVKPVTNQIDDLIEQIRIRVEKHERVLVTTLTKKIAEELTVSIGWVSGALRKYNIYKIDVNTKF